MLQKFILKVNKLNNYYILNEQESTITVSTTITLKETKSMMGNIFQPLTKEIDKEIAVFFLINMANEPSSLVTQFLNRKLPVLNISKGEMASKPDTLQGDTR